ncbi:hypothetical protein BDV06DRAFT_213591 [Aspergillus oleicola]
MAIPADITLKALKGSWTLQGVSWLTRKAISAANLTLHFTSGENEEQFPYLIMRQALTGGIPGSTEERIMDWVERQRSNHIYGDVLSRSKLVKGLVNGSGVIKPEIEVQSSAKDADKIKAFLTGGVPHLTSAEGDGEKDKDHADLYIHDFGRSEKGGWTAEQTWSFEVINSQPYLTRRVAVVRGDEFELSRLVYRSSGL